MKNLVLFCLFSTLLSLNLKAQVFLPEDKDIAASKFQMAETRKLSKLPINDLIVEMGKSFLGVEYVAHTLEADGDEQMVVNLRGLDCTTFLETSVALARSAKSQKITFDGYISELQTIRYRGGKIDHYPSRLHYFSDWIYDNTSKGIVKDITKDIGGKPIHFKVGFMSANPDKYKQLQNNSDYLDSIKLAETEINNREYYFIPKEEVTKAESKIKNGCLIAITSGVEGLDIAHVGIAVKMDDGRIHFMHAPIVGSKVQITETPLADYLAKNKKQTGIVVLQPLEPQM